MAESAADIKSTMDAMKDYLDRLYFTCEAIWMGKIAMMAATPGFPIWIHDKDDTTLPYRGLGQFRCQSLAHHSFVSEEGGRPGFLGASVLNPAFSSFDFALHEYAYKEPPGKASRTNTQIQTTYKVENIDEDIDVQHTPPHEIDLYIGGVKVLADLDSLDPDDWEGSVVRTKAANNFFRSIKYVPRHGFGLGRIFYLARGDTVKAGYFLDAENSCGPSPGTGAKKDLYHVYYAGLTDGYPNYYQWNPATYHDWLADFSGDCANKEYPWGIADDGCYCYPHDSKTRGQIPFIGIKGWPFFLYATRATGYVRMQWALHMLQKYKSPYAKFHDPAAGTVFAGQFNTLSNCIDVAEDAIAHWDDNNGLGYPPASGDNPYLPSLDKANGFTTPQFAIFMTVLGYGLGFQKYQSYADDAITQLRKATWGVGPQNSDGKGWIDGTEYTFPEHRGGVINVWKLQDNKIQAAEKGFIDKMFDELTFYNLLLPFGFNLGSLDGLNQGYTTPLPIPTGMECTVLAWMAMRIYLAYKYNDDYPDGTWGNGLDLVSGYLCGKVTASGQAVADAEVILVEGSTDAKPQELTSYAAKIKTDSNGAWNLPFEKTGNHTVYVAKSGYKHLRKVYNIGALDQNIFFPEAQLEAV